VLFVLSGEENFNKDCLNWPLVIRTSVVETFGRNPSDQSGAFKYLINHIFDNFHELVGDNLQWWEDYLMERTAVAIDKNRRQSICRFY